jgi:hypothetical protein
MCSHVYLAIVQCCYNCAAEMCATILAQCGSVALQLWHQDAQVALHAPLCCCCCLLLLQVVGGPPELGAWDAGAAPALTWGEGDVWTATLELPAGEHEFKVGGGSGRGSS